MPSCSPVEPEMTRTSRARIRPFTRNWCCSLIQSPCRRDGSVPSRRIFLTRNLRLSLSPVFPEHSGAAAAAIDHNDGLTLIIGSRGQVVSNIFALARRMSLQSPVDPRTIKRQPAARGAEYVMEGRNRSAQECLSLDRQQDAQLAKPFA